MGTKEKFKLTLILAAGFCVFASCAVPANNKAKVQNLSDLEVFFDIANQGSGLISCSAQFFDKATGTSVQLENTAAVVCNKNQMMYSSQSYTTVIPYTPGKPNRITIVRPTAGESMVSDEYYY